MAAFAVTGSTTSLGSKVVAGLGDDAVVTSVISGQPLVLNGVTCLISLAVGLPPPRDTVSGPNRLAGLREALAAAGAAGAERVVHLSSALVYGAAAENPVPLSEDEPVRPDPRFAWAVELAEAERLVAEWSDAGPERTAAVLRPALVVAPDDDGFLARALGGLSGPRPTGETRPVQFVHVDDVASAVVLCATSATPVDGPLNVAPEGWIDDQEAAALSGTLLPPPTLPARLVSPARRLAWAVGLGFTPPDAESYASHPWVVAADRLRSLGWAPAYTVEQAVVETTSCSTLGALSPHRRQELLLAGVVATASALLLTLVSLVRRALRPKR